MRSESNRPSLSGTGWLSTEPVVCSHYPPLSGDPLGLHLLPRLPPWGTLHTPVHQASGGSSWNGRWESTWLSAPPVPGTRLSANLLLVSFSPYLYLTIPGRISLWTFSLFCHPTLKSKWRSTLHPWKGKDLLVEDVVQAEYAIIQYSQHQCFLQDLIWRSREEFKKNSPIFWLDPPCRMGC